ncbi:MAG: small multi-drug export protein [Candidatus Andersenbacteria bacterium]
MLILPELVAALRGVPPWLATMIIAAFPVAELRGAIPVAIGIYKLPILATFTLSILGNMIPAYLLLVFFERVAAWLRTRSRQVDRLLTWLFARTRRKLERQVDQYGFWALALFVAIPLPVTGAWSGALAAFVFGFPKPKAFLAILVGVIVAAFVVTVLIVGADFFLRSLSI